MIYASRKARRYAEAVFSLAADQGAEVTLIEHLERLAEALAATPELGQVLAHRDIPVDRKLELAQQAAAAPAGESEAAGPVAPPALLDSFLRLVFDHHRVALLPEIAAALRGLLDTRDGVVRAMVTTAVPLLKAEREMITAKLEEITGARTVRLETRVRKEVVGGVVIHVGDQVIDASVRTYLDAVRDTLRRVRVSNFAEQGFLQIDLDQIRAAASQGRSA